MHQSATRVSFVVQRKGELCGKRTGRLRKSLKPLEVSHSGFVRGLPVLCSRSSNLAWAKSRTGPVCGFFVRRNSLITVISQDGMEDSASSRNASSGPPSLSKPAMLSRATKKRTSSKSRLVENIGFHRFIKWSFPRRLLDFFTLPVVSDSVRT
jgi:hypothetical protein